MVCKPTLDGEINKRNKNDRSDLTHVLTNSLELAMKMVRFAASAALLYDLVAAEC